MDRSDLLKLLVVFIAVIFVLSMFSQFGKGNISGTTTGNLTSTTIGIGSARCRIVAFSSEMTVDPWTNTTAAIAESLKAQKKIDYMNIIGKRGILILPSGGNISEVRAAFADISASTTTDASCSVTGLVNFTLQNGTAQPQAPGSVRLSLDPFSQVGDELNLDITADIGDAGITNMKVATVPDVTESATTASFECSSDYHVEANIAWESRELNMSAIASDLNVSTNAINYRKNDVVTFSRLLNDSEVESIKAKNLSYVYTVLMPGLQANTTDKSLITSLLSEYSNVTPVFQPSPITIDVGSELAMVDVMNLLNSKGGQVISTQRGCTLIITKIMEVNGKQMLVSSDARKMDYFLNTADVPDGTGNLSIFGNASYVGRIVTSFDMIGTK